MQSKKGKMVHAQLFSVSHREENFKVGLCAMGHTEIIFSYAKFGCVVIH